MGAKNEWTNIARTGTFTAKGGREVTLTEGDLDAIAQAYDPENREAPLVFGHPEDNQPAFGWVAALRRVGDRLQASFRQVPEAVRRLVEEGRYKFVSMSLFPDGKTLRHVGLLGAVQPAVDGLGAVRFAAGDEGMVVEFATENAGSAPRGDNMDETKLKSDLAEEARKRKEAEELAAKANAEAELAKKALADFQDGQRKKEIEIRVEKLVEGNKLLPAEASAVKAVALALGDGGTEIELSAGAGKKSVREHLFAFLDGLPARGLLTELSAPSAKDDKTGTPVDLTSKV